ncbi:MAG: ATP-binding cassette domain-containing protein [Kangiellaceae bacterium]
MIRLELNCRYQAFELRAKQDLACNQIIGLFGQSGSGKSRFLRQLIGLDQQNLISGKMFFEQTCWLDSSLSKIVNSADRGIGYLPQSIDLFPHLSVEQNLRFSPERCARKNNTIDFDILVNRLDLENLLPRYPDQLSGGQKQRVGLARAILAAQNLLVLDEPLSAQGETHKSQIMSYLKSLNGDNGMTIIFASHSRVEHAYLSQYLVAFEQGQIIQGGDYEQVASDITGQFAQTNDAINHILATPVSFEEQFYLNLLEYSGHQLWAGNKPLNHSEEVLLEIRATDISLSKTKDNLSSILNCIPVEIFDYYEIEKHQYLVKLKFSDIFLTTFITKKSFFELQLKKGMSLYAQFKSVSVLPFELDSTNSSRSAL